MKQAVAICTASPFMALVIRRGLARSSHLEPSGEHRSAGAALAAVRQTAGLVIVDAELFADGTDGGALGQALGARRAPSIVVDARGRGVPDGVAASPAVVVVRGRTSGELDLETIEAEILPAVGSALRRRSRSASGMTGRKRLSS